MRATISVLAAMAAAAGLAACTQEETKAPDDNNIHGLDTVRMREIPQVGQLVKRQAPRLHFRPPGPVGEDGAAGDETLPEEDAR